MIFFISEIAHYQNNVVYFLFIDFINTFFYNQITLPNVFVLV